MAGLVSVREVTSSVFLDADQVPPSKLPSELKTLVEFVADPTAMDCRNFTKQMKLWQEKELYKHFAPTWEQFCSDNFSQPLEWIEHVMVGVELLDGKQNVVTVQQAYDAGVRAKMLAETVKPLNANGTNQYNREDNGCYHDNTHEQRGVSSAYLAARIARDHPDVHEKMKAGEFRSVRAAAIEAGIVKPKSQPKDPVSLAEELKRRYPKEFLAELASVLLSSLKD